MDSLPRSKDLFNSLTQRFPTLWLMKFVTSSVCNILHYYWPQIPSHEPESLKPYKPSAVFPDGKSRSDCAPVQLVEISTCGGFLVGWNHRAKLWSSPPYQPLTFFMQVVWGCQAQLGTTRTLWLPPSTYTQIFQHKTKKSIKDDNMQINNCNMTDVVQNTGKYFIAHWCRCNW